MLTSGWFSILLTAMLAWSPPGDPPKVEPVAFKLQDFRGAWHRLDDVRESKVVVIAFLGTECPLASLYAPRLAELARAYEKKGVAFFGVDANQQDAPSALARFAREHDLPFPLLKDVGNELADRLGVERTPEVFVLDRGPRRCAIAAGWTTSSASASTARHRPAATWPRRSTTCSRAGRCATPRTEPAGCRVGRIAKGQGRCGRHLFQAGGPDPPRPLRRLPPRGGDRAVLADDVQAGRRLGRDDRRGGPGRPDAALARQPRRTARSPTRPG